MKLIRLSTLFLIIAVGTSSLLVGCASTDDDEVSAAELYLLARRAMNSAQFQTAIERFETLEARYPFSPYSQQAQLDLAYSYFRFSQPLRALAEADRFIRINPTHPNVDYAYYLKGLANFRRNQGLLINWFPRDPSLFDQAPLQEAFDNFATLIRRYPDSQYVKDAQQRMVYLRNQMATYELNVAKYYMDRKAFIAAAERARGVVENFYQTPAVPDALRIMVDAYEQLGLQDDADKAQELLQLNFS